MTDGHYPHYQEMLDQVDWNKYGVVNGVARDPRCENCMVHCGYDPSGALGVNSKPGDTLRMIKYNFGPRPAPSVEGRKVNAYTGYSIGKGHLAEAKAAIKSGLAGAKSVYKNNGGHTALDGNRAGRRPPHQRRWPQRAKPHANHE